MVGVKYLSIYKAHLTAVVQCRSHTQPRRWGRVGQREKLRTRNSPRKDRRDSPRSPGAFALEGPLTSRKGLLPLLAFMSTARRLGLSERVYEALREMSPEGHKGRAAWLSKPRLLTFPPSISSLSHTCSKVLTLGLTGSPRPGCRPSRSCSGSLPPHCPHDIPMLLRSR